MTTLASGLADAHEVHLLAPETDAALLAAARAAGATAVPLPGATEAARSEALRRWLLDNPVDLLHVHGGVSSEGCDAVVAATDLGVRVVRTEHQPLRSPSRSGVAPYLQVAALVERLVAVSEGVARSFTAGGVPDELVAVVRNGILEPRPGGPKPALLARLGLPATARVLLTVGRLDEQKGYPGLLAAAERVLPRHPDVHFLLVGEGPQEDEIRQAVVSPGLAGRVQLLGQRDDVHDLLHASYALVSPSLYEGLPLVVLEAMAAGLPVVGTRVTGTEEAVEDGVTGRLVPAADPDALAQALLGLLEDPETAAAWGAAGRRRFEAKFTAERMVSETLKVYEDIAHLP